ncbi:MAG: hypothetical protein OXH75_08255 [Acidobacteria bacterium]|nr:hypothetical protein [Acidobacteriota bacterium]
MTLTATKTGRLLLRCLLLAPLSIDAQAQQVAGQEVCGRETTGADIFSVGEVRTSILSELHFQELNGAEWVLMDGRPLLARTALSPHLSEEGEYGLVIPDARGRFLRMANNDACISFLGADNDEAWNLCLSERDPDGERVLGTYQSDAVGSHMHDYSDVFHTEVRGRRPREAHEVDTPGRIGSAADDYDNVGYGMERTTELSEGPETRPKNVAVNYYIKICGCRTANCK